MKCIKITDSISTAFLFLALTGFIFSFGNKTSVLKNKIIISGPIVIMGGGGDVEYSLISAFEEIEAIIPHMVHLSPLMRRSLDAPTIRGLQTIEDSMFRIESIEFDYSVDSAQKISFHGGELILYFKNIEESLDVESKASCVEFWIETLISLNPTLFRNNRELAARFSNFNTVINFNVAQLEFDGETMYSYVFENSISREPSVIIYGNRINILQSSINDRIGCSDEKNFIVLSQQLRSNADNISLILSLQVSCGSKVNFQTVAVDPFG